MAEDEAVLNLRRTDVNAPHVLDLVLEVDTLTAWLAHLIVMVQASIELLTRYPTIHRAKTSMTKTL